MGREDLLNDLLILLLNVFVPFGNLLPSGSVTVIIQLSQMAEFRSTVLTWNPLLVIIVNSVR